MKQKHLRVLVINGGGVRGLIPAVILDYISQATRKQIPELFDLIIGTSIGGILAAGYAVPKDIGNRSRANVKFTSVDMVDLIENHVDDIFPEKHAGKYSSYFESKYKRDPLDHLLDTKFKDTRMIDTLVPIVLVSVNANSSQPQLWYSCGPTYSQYAIKDAAGATSAAPTYFPSKFTKAKNCSLQNLVQHDGECCHESIDGGLFANSPALLLLYLWKQIMTDQTISICEHRYDMFNDTAGVHNLHLTISKDHVPQIRLGKNATVTIVSMGTGYFISNINELPEDVSRKWQVVSIIVFFISSVLTILNFVICCGMLLPKKQASTQESKPLLSPPSEKLPLFNLPQAMLGCCKTFLVSTKTVAVANIVTYVVLVVVTGFVSFNLFPKYANSKDGKLGAERLINEILKSNEESDLIIARNVFGTIAINPVFNEQIPLDDRKTFTLMKNIATDFVALSSAAFQNLSACLLDTEIKRDECDYASQYFYDDLTSHSSSIDSLRSLGDIQQHDQN